MPKNESELRDWVVQYNRSATHDRGLSSNYGYNAILDIDLVGVCAEMCQQYDEPIRVLDIGCGNGRALYELGERLEQAGLDRQRFELWGMGVNRYDEMWIPDERMLIGGIYATDFGGMQFHVVVSVYAFHYLWHKLETVEKIHNELLVDGGQAFLHFPGYLVRFGEKPEALAQTETTGNQRFREFLAEKQGDASICPMEYRTVPYFSDDDDRALLGEFGHVRFARTRQAPIRFDHSVEAFAMFSRGFAMQRMNDSGRIYIASHYGNTEHSPVPRLHDAETVAASVRSVPDKTIRAAMQQAKQGVVDNLYRLTTVSVEVDDRSYDLDVAVHACAADTVVLICPGACETLAGRLMPYQALANQIVEDQLGAVVRYNDPYDYQCDYAEFLLEKLRRMLDFILDSAEHICGTTDPVIKLMAYSSSAGAAAALAAEYPQIETLLFVAPSRDVPRDRIATAYGDFPGDVRVLVGDCDEVVLPQQAFWFYKNASAAASREYVEVSGCDHTFAGAVNKSVLLQAPEWAFGEGPRPDNFPLAAREPSEAWI